MRGDEYRVVELRHNLGYARRLSWMRLRPLVKHPFRRVIGSAAVRVDAHDAEVKRNSGLFRRLRRKLQRPPCELSLLRLDARPCDAFIDRADIAEIFEHRIETSRTFPATTRIGDDLIRWRKRPLRRVK